jgi:hypothetical protein
MRFHRCRMKPQLPGDNRLSRISPSGVIHHPAVLHGPAVMSKLRWASRKTIHMSIQSFEKCAMQKSVTRLSTPEEIS